MHLHETTDARTLSSGTAIDTDVCIIGAGAAGISVALGLANSSARVLLVESGGFVGDAETTLLNDGENVGLPYFPLMAARIRFFGGTTGHWGGWCMPPTAADFAGRPWIPYSGWPISLEALSPYVKKAQQLCELRPYEFEAWSWSDKEHPIPEVFRESRLVPAVTQFSPPTRFGTTYRPKLAQSRNVAILLNANVVEIETPTGGTTATRLHARTTTGIKLTLRPKLVVLAAGGIENARILLNSRTTWKTGLGNQHDLVGRFFADNLTAHGGDFWVNDKNLDLGFFHQHTARGGLIKGYLRLSEKTLEKFGMANVVFAIGPVYEKRYSDAAHSEGAESLHYLLTTKKHSETLNGAAGHVWNIVRDLNQITLATYRKLRYKRMPVDHYGYYIGSDPIPNPQSRVTLTDELDAVGMRKVRLDWRLTATDEYTFRRAQRLFAEEIASRNLGRARITDYPESAWPPLENGTVSAGWHHFGTTRMSREPSCGVVDADCRIHGVSNVFIAGSSVFPGTEGQPTMMLAALALRLADHIHKTLEAA